MKRKHKSRTARSAQRSPHPLRELRSDDPRRRPYQPKVQAFGAPSDRETAHIFVSGADPNHPDNDLIHAESEWAMDYLGVQSYSLVTGYASFALPQRLQSLLELGVEAARVSAPEREGIALGWEGRERLQMIQWVAASQVCMMIEELAAFTTAVAAWRRDGTDIARSYLGWRGDIAATINDPSWDTPTFWTDLVRYPGHGGLQDLGMTRQEAAAFAALMDGTLELVHFGVVWARRFFSDEMRRVYARFKHGFSLMSPLSAPVAIDKHLTERAAAATFGGSLLVLDQARPTAPIRLLAMRCSGYDLSRIQQAAAQVASTVGFIATSLMLEARSPERRAVTPLTLDLTPLTELERRAHEVYVGVERGQGRYSYHERDHVVRLQRDLGDAAARYPEMPLPLP